jgi:anti-sigma-K factor RskA
MSTPDDIDALAGEYVLGTLDPAERAAVAARRQREPVLDAAIIGWEQRLAPLQAGVAAVPPPPDLLQRIEQRIDAAKTTGPPLGSAMGTAVVELDALRRGLARWRRAAIAASAIAASALLVLGLRETVLREPPQTYVAVFAKDDIAPVFYLTVDLKNRELTLRPVGAERQPGKTYQMWIASEQIGTSPQSLGLVDDGLAPTRASLARYDQGLLQKATFGVSLEPMGGSPTGKPTSPALHAKLLPIAN